MAKTPADWPKHCTMFDRAAPDTLKREDWRYDEGISEGDEVVIYAHSDQAGLRGLHHADG